LNAWTVFLDETGFLTTPLVRRTWAPRGQTPVFRENRRTWEKATAVGALAISPARRRVRFLFSLPASENIHAAWLIHFLRDLKRHLGSRLGLIWDNLGLHKSTALRGFLGRQRSIRVWYLPPYAPELNPIELVWAQAKLGPLANWAPENITALRAGATGALDQIADDQILLRSLLRGVPLSLRLQ
jgi:transposase